MHQQRTQIQVRGIVQGVGFRPFVWRLARELNCTGWVGNDDQGVVLEVQGTPEHLREFLSRLSSDLPPLASISELQCQWVPLVSSEKDFTIDASQSGCSKRPTVPPDIGTCIDCERELFDPTNRRFHYPFINCTNCGPRFTILSGLPYDRAQTSMRPFEMCSQCRAEYESPRNRRFHAQPNACSECGPQVCFFLSPDVGQTVHGNADRTILSGCDSSYATAAIATAAFKEAAVKDAAIEAARELVQRGEILAVKGIGGFHLACDAKNDAAVDRLRQRKRRPFKPLAVMVADLDTAARYALIEPEEAQLLASPQRPIVLLRKRSATRLAPGIAPGNPQLGIMLGYSPLHLLLVRPGEVWVMTSGNLADEPICYENADAIARLSSICDGFLVHDRLIETVCDDSVVRVYQSRPLPIRRSRGYCPLPIEVRGTNSDEDSICALAVGGEIKTTVCLTIGTQAILGQHLGDTGNQETLLAVERSVDHLLGLYGVRPDVIVADSHPDYLSAAWAKNKATEWGVPWMTVQHHHAHAISLSAEHGLANEPMIACVFDGTGFGPDGAIWGGEWLIASPQEYRRFARLEYTPLPGGDAAIRRPAKTALAQLFHYGLEWNERLPCVQDLSNAERKLLRQQLQNRFHTQSTSSIGRLFDCVASICGVRHRVHYEGQAAIELENLATTLMSSDQDADRNYPAYPIDWQRQDAWVWNYRDMMVSIICDQLAGIGAAQIAARFHATLAWATAEICKQAREETSINTVGLSGGVFQNVLLTGLTNTLLERVGFRVLTHRQVPPNDGGLALGQAVIGRAMLTPPP